jgi:formylglycine-generating enzyme required for sulfatase activity
MGQSGEVFADDYRQVPEHPVVISDFSMSIYEVTNADFSEFVSATNYKTTAENLGSAPFYNESTDSWELKAGVDWRNPKGAGKGGIRGKERNPVCVVCWFDAEQYCKWRSAKEGLPEGGIRLATEAEFEFVARGKEGRTYPWGETPPFERKNNKYVSANLAIVDAKWHEPVGKIEKGKSPDGIYDLIGNVWEWCYDRASDLYYKECKEKGTVVDPMGPPLGDLRAVRGGGFDSDPESARATKRFFMAPDQMSPNVGFRVVFIQ